MSNYDEIPDWIKTVEEYPNYSDEIWSLQKAQEVVEQLNFLKVSYVGAAMKIDELEAKFAMALEYQNEVDARILDKRGYTDAARILRED